jgi:hypothetical protein
MTEIDDLEEIDLSADRSGSTKQLRARRKAGVQINRRLNDRPLWRKQINPRRRKPVKVTLSSNPSASEDTEWP